jgi:nitrite reductase/ring-hydroxylating ferredoxin subunit
MYKRRKGQKMVNWIEVGAADALPDGAMQEVQVGDRTVLLARVGGTYHATQARCPHLRAHLAKGKLDGNVVTCPAHGSTFDVTTGRNLAWVDGLPGLVKSVAAAIAKRKDLAVYSVKVEDGHVWVDVQAGS